jgi:undecaprenyl-diphosphatase
MSENTKFKLILGFLAILALVISICARLAPKFPGDLCLTLWLQSSNNHLILSTMECISSIFGGWSAVLVVVATGIIVWWRVGRLEAIMIVAGGLITLVNTPLKLAINRPRPLADLVHVLSPEQGNGFPSGHAFFAILILGLTAYFVFTNLKNRTIGIVVLAGLIVLILLIGTSRVYLGVHWPSDVIGGYLIGGVLLTALIWFHQTWKTRHSQQHKRL